MAHSLKKHSISDSSTFRKDKKEEKEVGDGRLRKHS